MYVYLQLDDQDHHEQGCSCGLCNSNGKSYGCAIYDMTTFGITCEEEVAAEWVQDALKEQDPLERIYGPSEPSAVENAAGVCQERGWVIVGRATYEQMIEKLLGALRGLVGSDGYLTTLGACQCHDNHTACHICWARYFYEVFSSELI